MKSLPVLNHVYTYQQIVRELAVGDQPYLYVMIGGVRSMVQLAHCSPAEMMGVPGWPHSRWQYRSDDDLAPTFDLVDTNPEFLTDHEEDIDPFLAKGKPTSLWVTPKTLYRLPLWRRDEQGEAVPVLDLRTLSFA